MTKKSKNTMPKAPKNPVPMHVMDSDGEMMGKFPKYQIEDAASTLMKAHEIMADTEKMRHVTKHLKMKKQAISSVAQLRKIHNEKFGPKEEVGEKPGAPDEIE